MKKIHYNVEIQGNYRFCKGCDTLIKEDPENPREYCQKCLARGDPKPRPKPPYDLKFCQREGCYKLFRVPIPAPIGPPRKYCSHDCYQAVKDDKSRKWHKAEYNASRSFWHDVKNNTYDWYEIHQPDEEEE